MANAYQKVDHCLRGAIYIDSQSRLYVFSSGLADGSSCSFSFWDVTGPSLKEANFSLEGLGGLQVISKFKAKKINPHLEERLAEAIADHRPASAFP